MAKISHPHNSGWPHPFCAMETICCMRCSQGVSGHCLGVHLLAQANLCKGLCYQLSSVDNHNIVPEPLKVQLSSVY